MSLSKSHQTSTHSLQLPLSSFKCLLNILVRFLLRNCPLHFLPLLSILAFWLPSLDNLHLSSKFLSLSHSFILSRVCPFLSKCAPNSSLPSLKKSFLFQILIFPHRENSSKIPYSIFQSAPSTSLSTPHSTFHCSFHFLPKILDTHLSGSKFLKHLCPLTKHLTFPLKHLPLLTKVFLSSSKNFPSISIISTFLSSSSF